MSLSKTEKAGSDEAYRKRKDRAAEVANTFEWLITAFILAFVFRAFVMEAFRIPTGSMADTLKGAHFRLRCQQCGYKYEYGYVTDMQDTIPAGGDRLYSTRCPSCGHYSPGEAKWPVANGDRILVLKCIYQFFEPKRWDVIVFKNPLNPLENYIKRLIALPGEKLEIIDGDIYINGEIARKPPHVQNELWMPVYDNDYQPVEPNERYFNGHRWRPPFNFAESKWEIDKNNPTEFHLDCPPGEISALVYGGPSANDFKTAYAYNEIGGYNRMPACSDLMMRFYARLSGPQGRVGIGLSKYGANYKAWVDLRGEMVIAEVSEDHETILDSKLIAPPAMNKLTLVQFANVDRQLTFQFGSEKISYDLGRTPDAIDRSNTAAPQAEIFGSGKLTLCHATIFRDIHYTGGRNPRTGEAGRATEGNPFTLPEDGFFVLGDNSPNSEDCRWWGKDGKANWGQSYPKGIVPRDYLVGKAMFVYWPSGFRPFASSRFSVVPNVGRMRFIYGGSNKSQ